VRRLHDIDVRKLSARGWNPIRRARGVQRRTAEAVDALVRRFVIDAVAAVIRRRRRTTIGLFRKRDGEKASRGLTGDEVDFTARPRSCEEDDSG
jgi:hypothetical protein